MMPLLPLEMRETGLDGGTTPLRGSFLCATTCGGSDAKLYPSPFLGARESGCAHIQRLLCRWRRFWREGALVIVVQRELYLTMLTFALRVLGTVHHITLHSFGVLS